jgi:hypothetical protein
MALASCFPKASLGSPEVVRRFWYRWSAAQHVWHTLVPVVFALAYVACFAATQLTLFMLFPTGDDVRDFFENTNEIGVSLRHMEHAVNALVLGYLASTLGISLLPQTVVQRFERILLLVAIVLVAHLHWVIP